MVRVALSHIQQHELEHGQQEPHCKHDSLYLNPRRNARIVEETRVRDLDASEDQTKKAEDI